MAKINENAAQLALSIADGAGTSGGSMLSAFGMAANLLAVAIGSALAITIGAIFSVAFAAVAAFVFGVSFYYYLQDRKNKKLERADIKKRLPNTITSYLKFELEIYNQLCHANKIDIDYAHFLNHLRTKIKNNIEENAEESDSSILLVLFNENNDSVWLAVINNLQSLDDETNKKNILTILSKLPVVTKPNATRVALHACKSFFGGFGTCLGVSSGLIGICMLCGIFAGVVSVPWVGFALLGISALVGLAFVGITYYQMHKNARRDNLDVARKQIFTQLNMKNKIILHANRANQAETEKTEAMKQLALMQEKTEIEKNRADLAEDQLAAIEEKSARLQAKVVQVEAVLTEAKNQLAITQKEMETEKIRAFEAQHKLEEMQEINSKLQEIVEKQQQLENAPQFKDSLPTSLTQIPGTLFSSNVTPPPEPHVDNLCKNEYEYTGNVVIG